jgi:glycosyltransferase involved in cell wall biosynthesis
VDASIIVPLTGDPERTLRMLEALACVPDDPRHEVILVDDASHDLAPLLQRVGGDVQAIRLPLRVGTAAAVRAGAAVATGDVVVLLCEGALVHPRAFGALCDALADAQVAGATAAARHPTAATAVAWRRAAGIAIPDAPDDQLVAALCCTLAARGQLVCAPLAIVEPAGATTLPAPRARRMPGTAIEVSIAIPTLDAAGDRLRDCVRTIQDHTDAAYEIVIVDNGAPPQGFTDPVNAALRAARGRHLVVCNDDVLVQRGWWAPLRAALEDVRDPASVVFPQTIDGAMREDFAAWCFAMSRTTLERFAVQPGEFLHPSLRVWYQDTDLLVRLRAAGVPPRLVPASTIRHGLSQTVATPDPQLRDWIDAQIRRDKAAFEALHGTAVSGAAV